MRQLYTDADAGRLMAGSEGGKPWRDEYMRDYGRVVHSASFRRLQGKTQVFPGHESDFFRNRLTHSLEVAQIAEGIVDRLNHEEDFFKGRPLKSRLCATAALLHDLGHPPFGHNGERALDESMLDFGGFEGNAQTLRIVSFLEKKAISDGRRYGLNLTYRTLAGILKYDAEIPAKRKPGSKVAKGYYASEAELVARIKREVCGSRVPRAGEFKTVECAVMDLADDIAYSTFDLEDALKAGFVTPASILASSKALLSQVAVTAGRELGTEVSPEDVIEVFQDLFEDMLGSDVLARASGAADQRLGAAERALDIFAGIERASSELVGSGHLRTKMSSKLVKDAIEGVSVDPDEEAPALTKVFLDETTKLRVEVLKQYVYEATISTHRVKIAEYRGTRIVREIFGALSGPKGSSLMPDDVRRDYDACAGDERARMRVVCDFVAGMTDRYAAEFYARLNSDAPQSMFKPL